MSYLFSGVLSKQCLVKPYPNDTSELVFREINHPQVRSGVLFVEQNENYVDEPDEETQRLIKKPISLWNT